MSFTIIGASYPNLQALTNAGALQPTLQGDHHNLSIQHSLPAGSGTYNLATANTLADTTGTYNLMVTCVMHDGTRPHFLDFKAYVSATSMTYYGPYVSDAVFGITRVGNQVTVTMTRNGVTTQTYNVKVEIRPLTLDPTGFIVSYTADAAKKTQVFY